LKIGVTAANRLSISVFDSLEKAEFYEKDLELKEIGVNTVFKALEKTKKEIHFSMSTKKIDEHLILEIKVNV
jgi:hypothetical protein